ncbi:MAG: PLP-dependent aminotransferase family protein [Negativicutes bacterium]|nr:PLP-dependent aminotransferase family protein [Negativicutes bacterium]
MEMIAIDPADKEPLYMQLYHHFKVQIEQNRLKEDDRLPSIRGLAQNLSLSKITVEKAYQQLLSEGYIENRNRSRYTVNRFEGIAFASASALPAPDGKTAPEPVRVRYDFASGEMDIDGFDFVLWKRYVSKVFLHKERLLGYGHFKGEEELRTEIAGYLQKSRGVYADKEQIIIGPGVQNLLNMLCSMLKAVNSTIAFEEPGFKNGRRIFADRNFRIIPIPMKKDGIDMGALVDCGARLIYVSPSHQFPTGYIMPAGKRIELLKWAEKNDGLIIEDDYDSEFRYFGRPIPALRGLDKGEKVVYLGSFSKVMPPSIRISYMVLPPLLLELFQKNASLYNQAASTLEQLALAQFMADGHLERQIRRLRKLYSEKKQLFFNTVKSILGSEVEVKQTESGLHTTITVKNGMKAAELAERALKKGCRVASVQDYYWESMPEKPVEMILYFSKIPTDEMEVALRQLQDAWFSAAK